VDDDDDEGDGDADVIELEEAGALLDDPDEDVEEDNEESS
jgi:hypothetical protein